MATVAASVSAGRAVLPVLLPDHQVDLAVAVFVATGVSGSQTAGPVLEAFLR